MVSAVPPASGPLFGATLAITGSALYAYAPLAVTDPAVDAGTTQLTCVALALTVTPVAAAPPTVTVTAPRNPVPLSVSAVPPASGPLFGATLAIAGSAL